MPPGIDRADLDALLNIVQPEHITKLYKSYFQSGSSAAVTRQRGKSPRQAAFFFRNPEVTFHAAQLANLFLEAYLELHAPVSISFEHAWFLLLALARHDEVGWPAARIAAVYD